MRYFSRKSLLLGAVGAVLGTSAYLAHAVIVTPADARLLGLDSLSTVPVPEPPNLATFVRNKQAAIALGKAFFWDQQVGSDGQACASCHFHAGADNRKKNQLSPGVARVIDPTRAENTDTAFGDAAGLTASGARSGPNYTLNAADFPFHQLTDPLDRNSIIAYHTNDVASSQGTFGNAFTAPGGATTVNDTCGVVNSTVFHVNGTSTRKVEPRNTPTTINAVFNFRNFWDGRANFIFNGLNPLGRRGNLATATDTNPGVLVMDARGRVTTVPLEITNASLASQAVGPALSDFEMSCSGRLFVDIANKLLTRKALAFQPVSRSDSVLGTLRSNTGLGLSQNYRQMIQAAFQPAYWAKNPNQQRFTAFGDPIPAGTTGGYSQMEVNFAMFWGLAIQLYEATLVSNRSPFDLWMEGNPRANFSADALAGLNVFTANGNCVICHAGAEFTTASVRQALGLIPPTPLDPVAPGMIERMPLIDTLPAIYDTGFYNIGLVPTFEDLGIGGVTAGFPISFSRQVVTGQIIDNIVFDPALFVVPGPIVTGERVDVDGAFKTPTIRNAELTGPYFHNGGYSTLAQLVEFYNRGGNRRDVPCQGGVGDTSGFDTTCTNVPPPITPLGLTAAEQLQLVEFIKSTTDPRVRTNAAPFDHPGLVIPNGHAGDQTATVLDATTGQAADDTLLLPAIGRRGGAAIQPFDVGL